MTMTTPACPMRSYLTEEVREAILAPNEELKKVDVQLVWDPPWSPQMISKEGRRYPVEDSLRDGAIIQVRAIRPDDKARLVEHFAGLNAESRYVRFFGHKRELTNEDLA